MSESPSKRWSFCPSEDRMRRFIAILIKNKRYLNHYILVLVENLIYAEHIAKEKCVRFWDRLLCPEPAFRLVIKALQFARSNGVVDYYKSAGMTHEWHSLHRNLFHFPPLLFQD
jgi:hypothetical protein